MARQRLKEGGGSKTAQPLVAIIGRSNVGKSTLFNRIIQQRLAVVADEPGITRDRHYAPAEWSGYDFILIDTGGMIPDSAEPLEAAVRQQAEIALQEADVVLFMVDIRAGLTPLDEQIAQALRQHGKSAVVVVANKADNERFAQETGEFSSLGLGQPIPVSAVSGRGMGDLLDQVVALFDRPLVGTADHPKGLQVAIVGRPNVGKSSLVNAIVRQEKVIVSDSPGTTRDAIDTVFYHHDTCFILIDTAGLRRRSRYPSHIEFFSGLRTQQSLAKCDVAVVVCDATMGITTQDVKIAAEVINAGKGLVVAINKWDLVDVQTSSGPSFVKAIRQETPALTFAPILFISAVKSEGLERLLNTVMLVHNEGYKRIPTSQLNRVLQDLLRQRAPPSPGGKPIRIFFATQVTVKPPTLVFFTNRPEAIPEAYQRFLANQLRDRFGFVGTPLRLHFRWHHSTRSNRR